MTTHDDAYVVNQSVQSANSPEVFTLRTSTDEVPQEVSAYRVSKAIVAEVATASGEVGFQEYDDDGATIEQETTVTIAADETDTFGDGDDDPVVRVDRGNQIRIRATTDVEVTLYLIPDDL